MDNRKASELIECISNLYDTKQFENIWDMLLRAETDGILTFRELQDISSYMFWSW